MSWRHKKMIPMPLVGAVRAGEPLVADEHLESVFPLPAEMVGSDNSCFILVVRGDSMINAGIEEGDYLIVSEQDHAQDGDIVVALVGNDDATVKRFYKEDDHIRLQPENDAYKPIISKDVTIRGKVIGLYRHFDSLPFDSFPCNKRAGACWFLLFLYGNRFYSGKGYFPSFMEIFFSFRRCPTALLKAALLIPREALMSAGSDWSVKGRLPL